MHLAKESVSGGGEGGNVRARAAREVIATDASDTKTKKESTISRFHDHNVKLLNDRFFYAAAFHAVI